MKSDYYQCTYKPPLACRVSLQVRQKIFATFMNVMQPQEDARTMDLVASQSELNFFERWYLYKDRPLCVPKKQECKCAHYA